MAMTKLTYRRAGLTSIMLFFESDKSDPTFYVYKDRVLIRETSRRSVSVAIQPGESPIFTVTDDPAELVPFGRGNTGTIKWLEPAAGYTYKVQQHDGAQWVTREQRKFQNAKTFRHQTGPLDEAGDSFRLEAIDSLNRSGGYTPLTANPVRNPDHPKVSLAYSAGTGKVTISAA